MHYYTQASVPVDPELCTGCAAPTMAARQLTLSLYSGCTEGVGSQNGCTAADPESMSSCTAGTGSQRLHSSCPTCILPEKWHSGWIKEKK